MEADPDHLLRGDTPRLVDEWQENLRSGMPYVTRWTGAGLTASSSSWVRPPPGDEEMAGEAPQSGTVDVSLSDVAERLVVGGWPGHLDRDAEQARLANANYVRLLTSADMRRAAGPRRSPTTARRVLQSLARHVSTECGVSRMAADATITRETVAAYLGAYDRLMVRANLPAWNTHIRSRARLRTSPKRHLCDTSLACTALGLTPARLLADLEYLGLLFESAAIHDLRVYARAMGGELAHYRDSNGLEADVIIEFPDTSWAAGEVKLGFGAVPGAAATLLAVAANIDQDRMGPPRALVVVTGAGYAHKRPDGVCVVPLETLRE